MNTVSSSPTSDEHRIHPVVDVAGGRIQVYVLGNGTLNPIGASRDRSRQTILFEILCTGP